MATKTTRRLFECQDGVGRRRPGRGAGRQYRGCANSQEIISYGPAGEEVRTGGGVSDEKDACRDQAIERLADDLGISTEEAEELLEIARELVDAEEFDAFVEDLCDQ